MRITRKRLILIILIVLIGSIVLFTVIYQQTALWTPEQSLITLLPESPIGYFTLKDLEGMVKTFNRSEFGIQVAQMPILTHIKNQLWWRQIVYQKLLWEHEMGGRLDMNAVKGHFGEEAIIALYQRDGELSFLLITEVGGPEKLAIEAITATDAINPKYKRIQTEYKGLTINTITGYPLDFSYTFIGKIGVLTLNPLLLAEVIDIYAGNKNGFLVDNPIQDHIQDSYNRDKNTGYVDIPRLNKVLKGLATNINNFVEQNTQAAGKTKYLTIGNRYVDGVIVSDLHLGYPDKLSIFESEKLQTLKFLPEDTALVFFNPHQNWTKVWEILRNNLSVDVSTEELNLAQHLDTNMTIALVTHGEGETSKLPSLIIHSQIKDISAFGSEIERLKNTKISIGSIPVEFLEPQNYKDIIVQPIRLRLNILLALTGAYAVVDNNFFFSTTFGGLISVLDVYSGDSPTLDGVRFANNSMQTIIQPNLLVPEIERLIPVATLLASFSGYKLDAGLMQHIKDNLFPLEYLGPITADVHVDEKGVHSEVRIVLENKELQ